MEDLTLVGIDKDLPRRMKDWYFEDRYPGDEYFIADKETIKSIYEETKILHLMLRSFRKSETNYLKRTHNFEKS